MSSAQQAASIASPTPAQPTIATSDATTKPKPCCVCTQEKSKRDECMLFSKASDPSADCKSTIDEYRTCMAGFGFKV
ncbi:Cytochrome c oxidase copper chaperone [Niveomyces insectorum RCEF 264]|uniref:Cytochrome c oxidase copper chaperone n=1 Tax=Niveomyces insectorum RCEF 264 TaxID=1081102 RepID=A0A167UWX2_9HYPO|nr:Cytochrome c oxidase copper chaperone [Niveomyces insectorum RCEF 264]